MGRLYGVWLLLLPKLRCACMAALAPGSAQQGKLSGVHLWLPTAEVL